MRRALTPHLIIAALVMVAAGIAYRLGAPEWVAYAAIIVAMLAVMPGCDRWGSRAASAVAGNRGQTPSSLTRAPAWAGHAGLRQLVSASSYTTSGT